MARGFRPSRYLLHAILEPHVKQLPQRLRAAGLPVLTSRPTGSHPRHSKTTCAALTTSELTTSPALAVPSTPYGTQASPSATRSPTASSAAPPQCASNRKTYASHPHGAPANTTSVTGHADELLPSRAQPPPTQALPLPPQLLPLPSILRPLQRPPLALPQPPPQPPPSRPCPACPTALPSPLRPPSHALHKAMIFHSSNARAPSATPSRVTCWHCSPDILSQRTYV